MEQELKLQALTPDRGPSVTDIVYRQLYDGIVCLDMPPGTKLSEADVAQKLAVSRQPVRDAFYRLSQQGFLLIRPQRATVVTQISTAAVHKARFIRTALEIETCCTAITKATSADIMRLEENLRLQKQVLNSGSRDDFHELDDEFHATICATAGHPEVWTLIKDNKAHMDRVRYLSLDKEGTQIAYDEHCEILKALINKDKTKVTEAIRSHLNRISKSISTIRAEHINYFDEEDREL
ncbi:GntR family transcriptional regulator [Pacificibacter maritimus]|uniref:GntR family transcriptional regulator n=2 Tax=Pacificibacter maritimus TaxID=762213 RepID=A0A3N4VFH6_9RHOB|nr:GntR family transcriptional regulator [Pacificibacter maritimus]